MGVTTLAEAMRDAAAKLAPSPTARRDAELLLLHTAGISRAELLTYPGRAFSPQQLHIYLNAIARRSLHEPVQYITGLQEFYGRTFAVSPAVLIPRPETEHLIEAALECMRASRPNELRTFSNLSSAAPSHRISPSRIADIGTGSGILAITLALELPNATVTATDLSSAALAVAQRNAAALGATERIRFLVSDLFAAFAPSERFDCIVSNPPYVPRDEVLEPEVRDYEPAGALYAGVDGLEVYRRLVPQAAAALEPGGCLLLELGHGQREAIEALLRACGFTEVRFWNDLQQIPRVAAARSPLENFCCK